MHVDAVSTSSGRMPNRKVLWAILVIGVVMLVAGLGLSGYVVVHDYMMAYNGVCVSDPSWSWYNSGIRCSGIRWYYWVLPIAIGFVATVAASMMYRHYYVRVYDGVVVGLDITSGWYNTFHVCLKGLTLAGEERTYWVQIRYDDWRKLKDGDHFSW